LVSRLRGFLGAGVVLGGPAGYRLGDTVRIDLEEARQLLLECDTRLDQGGSGTRRGRRAERLRPPRTGPGPG
jgi:hypothetical protein